MVTRVLTNFKVLVLLRDIKVINDQGVLGNELLKVTGWRSLQVFDHQGREWLVVLRNLIVQCLLWIGMMTGDGDWGVVCPLLTIVCVWIRIMGLGGDVLQVMTAWWQRPRLLDDQHERVSTHL
jgi:hypothetical protein